MEAWSWDMMLRDEMLIHTVYIIGSQMAVRLSALRTDHSLFPRNIIIRGWVYPRPSEAGRIR
jgi:hypothetical protein